MAIMLQYVPGTAQNPLTCVNLFLILKAILLGYTIPSSLSRKVEPEDKKVK